MNGQSRNALLILVLVVVGVLVLLPVLVMPMMWGMMGGWTAGTGMMGGSYWWGWLVMLLFWVLLIGGIALVAIWLVRQGYIGRGPARGTDGSGGLDLGNSGSGGSGSRGGQSALEILSQRYARGEIDREQYEQVKRDILAD